MRWALVRRFDPRAHLIVLAALIAATLVLTATPARAQNVAGLPSLSYPVPVGGLAKPLSGWSHFCAREPAECAVDPAEPAMVELTPKTWQAIVRINRAVNDQIEAKLDQDHWGVEDRWDLPEDGAGDCEDYQLLKRSRLVKAGLPRRALRMTVVVDEKGEGHAVLTVRTNRGDFILDNKRHTVLPWAQTGYTFIKREGDTGQAWVSLIGTAASPAVTAGR